MSKRIFFALFFFALVYFVVVQQFSKHFAQINPSHWREQALAGRQQIPLIHQGQGALAVPGRIVSVRSDRPQGPSGIIAFSHFEYEAGGGEPEWLKKMGNPVLGARAGAQMGPLTIVEVDPGTPDKPLHPRLMTCKYSRDVICLEAIQELLNKPRPDETNWPIIETCLSESVEVCTGMFQAILGNVEKLSSQDLPRHLRDLLLTMLSINSPKKQTEMRELLLATPLPIAKVFVEEFSDQVIEKPQVLRSLLKSVYDGRPVADFVTQSFVQRIKNRPYERKQLEESLTASGLRWPPTIQEALIKEGLFSQ